MLEKIKDMSEHSLNVSAGIMARAFYDDPLFRHAIPEPQSRKNRLPGLFRLNLEYGMLFGETFCLPEQGLAIWLPPGKTRITIYRALQAGMWLTPVKIGLKAVIRLASLNTISEKYHDQVAPDPHWYLFLLGVDPAFQGQGLGGQLIKPILDWADSAQTPCYLETNNPLAVRFYKKYGFAVAAEHSVSSGGLLFWSMRRENR